MQCKLTAYKHSVQGPYQTDCILRAKFSVANCGRTHIQKKHGKGLAAMQQGAGEGLWEGGRAGWGGKVGWGCKGDKL